MGCEGYQADKGRRCWCKQDFLFGGAVGEGAGGDRGAPVDAVGADIKGVLADARVGVILPGQVAEAADAVVQAAETDLDLVRMRNRVVVVGVPERVGIPVKGIDGFIAGVLAVGIDQAPVGLGSGAAGAPPLVVSPLVVPPLVVSPLVVPPLVVSPLVVPPLVVSPLVVPPLVVSPLVVPPLVVSPLVVPPLVVSPLVVPPLVVSPLVVPPLVVSPLVVPPLVVSPLVVPPLVVSPLVVPPLVVSPLVVPPLVVSPLVVPPLVVSPLVVPPFPVKATI